MHSNSNITKDYGFTLDKGLNVDCEYYQDLYDHCSTYGHRNFWHNHNQNLPNLDLSIKKFAKQFINAAINEMKLLAEKGETCQTFTYDKELPNRYIIHDFFSSKFIAQIFLKQFNLRVTFKKQSEVLPKFENLSVFPLDNFKSVLEKPADYVSTLSWDADHPVIYNLNARKRYRNDLPCRVNKMWKMAEEAEDTDITFAAKDETEKFKNLYAHKLILKMESVYLHTQVNAKMGDQKECIITIEGFSHEIFKYYLQFLYQGELNLDFKNNISSVVQLFLLGSQYDDQKVKDFCFDIMEEWVSSREFTDVNEFTTVFDLSFKYDIHFFFYACVEQAEKRPECLQFFLELVDKDNINLIKERVSKTSYEKVKEQLALK